MKAALQKHASLLLIGFTAAVTAAFLLLVYFPGRQALASARATIHEQRATVAEASDVSLQIKTLEQRASKAEAIVHQWRQSAPDRQQLSGVLALITLHAAQAGVHLAGLEPQKSEALRHIERHRIDVRLQGTFPQLHDFLRRLESMPQSIWIDRVNIAPNGKDGQSLRCELSLSIFGKIDDFTD